MLFQSPYQHHRGTEQKSTQYITRKIHTRFCCDAWSRNCCAVSNSVLSSNTYIKPTIPYRN